MRGYGRDMRCDPAHWKREHKQAVGERLGCNWYFGGVLDDVIRTILSSLGKMQSVDV